ncbi:MAG: amidohydrolase [Spirulina sp. DLM2.Bin59]|nr:MAG: amidohydrolase [Spirulina sp. DLM2.Bin59]
MSFTIKQAVSPTATGYEILDLYIEGEEIQAIAPELPPRGTVIDGSRHLLLPGFVNAHTHSPEVWQRGAIAPYPLELWLTELYAIASLTPDHIYLSAIATAVETLLSGGTTVVDHLILLPGQELETIAAAVRGYQAVGIRAFIGPLIYDQHPDAGIPKGDTDWQPGEGDLNTGQILEILETAVQRFHRPEAGISIMVAPTGMQLCSDPLFRGCVDLSDRHNLCRHTHLLETKAQQQLAQEKYGCSAVAHLEKLGFLSPRTSLAHCVWLDDADIEILAATGSTVVHNPLSNLRLGSGIAPVLKYAAAGVNVSFGCDGSASNDGQDLLEAIKIGMMLHNITDADYRHWLTPRMAVEMAALGGARGLNLGDKYAIADRLGTLHIGQQADLVLYDLQTLSLLPKTDPLGLLVMGRPTNAVAHSWVRGEQIMAGGKPTRLELAQLCADLDRHSLGAIQRPSPDLMAVEAHYRQVMGLPI